MDPQRSPCSATLSEDKHPLLAAGGRHAGAAVPSPVRPFSAFFYFTGYCNQVLAVGGAKRVRALPAPGGLQGGWRKLSMDAKLDALHPSL